MKSPVTTKLFLTVVVPLVEPIETVFALLPIVKLIAAPNRETVPDGVAKKDVAPVVPSMAVKPAIDVEVEPKGTVVEP